MTPRGIFLCTVVVSLAHGLMPTSPVFLLAYLLTPLWIPDLITLTQETWFYFASLVTATATLLLSAIPAGLYERVAGLERSNRTSMLVWLCGAVLVTAPGFLGLAS
jgi:hypothetical protein